MSRRKHHTALTGSIVFLTILSACATDQPPVIERMDERTAVTITNSRTPIIMSRDTPYTGHAERDFLRIGVFEINQMGNHQYYLWLGISHLENVTSTNDESKAFETITVSADNNDIRLSIRGWTPEVVGAGESIYKKLFRSSSEAYYEITVNQIQMLVDANDLKLSTTGAEPIEFVPWYEQATARNELAEFLKAVSQ